MPPWNEPYLLLLPFITRLSPEAIFAAGSAYTDAKNTNNTVTLSGDELVRLLGL
jgi:hypothetical protein